MAGQQPQLWPVAERVEGTQHTGRLGSWPGREKTNSKTQPACQKHPTGYTPTKVPTGKPQRLQIPVPSLKEQLAEPQVTATEPVPCPTPQLLPYSPTHCLASSYWFCCFCCFCCLSQEKCQSDHKLCVPLWGSSMFKGTKSG